jgi:hypothetical protein
VQTWTGALSHIGARLNVMDVTADITQQLIGIQKEIGCGRGSPKDCAVLTVS